MKFILNIQPRSETAFISVKFKDEEFYPMFRHQALTMKDFLSNIGGLMGLFAGISVLSIVEVFYFFSLRLLVELWRNFAKKLMP